MKINTSVAGGEIHFQVFYICTQARYDLSTCEQYNTKQKNRTHKANFTEQLHMKTNCDLN